MRMLALIDEIIYWLPFIIPLYLLQTGLMIAALIHIFRHKEYKMGNRTLWAAVSICIGIIGPAAYFIFGKSEE